MCFTTRLYFLNNRPRAFTAVYSVNLDDLHHFQFLAKTFTTLAGLPTARLYGGMSFVTKEPTPIIAPSPIVTPGIMIDLIPIQQPLFKTIGPNLYGILL